MNCFQLVRFVLDELYQQIDASDDAERDRLIRDELGKLHSHYLHLARGDRVDYSSPATRFAYVFRYVTSHADLVCQLITKCGTLSSLFTSAELRVTCVGGGPGSDLVGILKHMSRSGSQVPLTCWIYDREQAWAECWCDVDRKLTVPFRTSTYFLTFDVTDQATWFPHTKYLGSDLFTMIYFLSEVYAFRAQAEGFFRNLFRKAKAGARFLYVDNNSPEFYGWFDAMVAASGLMVCQQQSGEIQLGTEEEKRDLGAYFGRLGNPKLTADVAYRVLMKV